jgi:hypothetical protein
MAFWRENRDAFGPFVSSSAQPSEPACATVDEPCPAPPPISPPISPSTSPSTPRNVPDRSERVAVSRAVRLLLVAFAIVRLLDAVGVPVDPVGSIMIGLAGLMVLGHVVGTIVGTSRRNATDAERAGAPLANRGDLAAAIRSAEAPSLHRHLPLERRVVYWIVAGALCCAAAMAVTTMRAWPKMGPLGVVILEMSAGTIGAYIGFMTSRLSGATRRAWRQATGEAAGS